MLFESQSQQGPSKIPATTIHQFLDGHLILFLRAWGSQDFNQKFTDEVTRFLSTSQADIEITSPFENLESLTSLANKVRISLLLAHDYFYKVENKTSYSVGFEAAILISNKQELAWGAVGRFDIYKMDKSGPHLLSGSGSDQDSAVLLPVDIVGVEKDFNLRCGSCHLRDEEIFVASLFGTAMVLKPKQDHSGWEPNIENPAATYWISRIKSE